MLITLLVGTDKMGNIIRPRETWKDNIIKPDPYIDEYVAQKQLDPDALIVLKQFRKRDVDIVDHIVELAHGHRDYVQNESDWVVIEALFNFFANQWPQEYKEFKSAIPQIREAKGEGYSKSREIMHTGSVPMRFMRMVKAIFPMQPWDKKFTSKLYRRMPLFKVGEIAK